MSELPKAPGADRPHLSVSQINEFLGCGWKYYLKRIERKKTATRARMAFGRAAHATVADDLREFLTPERIDIHRRERIRDVFRRELAQEMSEVELDRNEIAEYVTRGRAQEHLKKRGDRVLDVYLDESPIRDPLAVEKKIRIPTAGDFDLLVIPDVMERGAVGDLKFGIADHDADASLQLSIEAAAYAQEFGELPARVYIEKYKVTATSATRERVESKRDADDIRTFSRIAETVAEAIGHDSFLPNALGTWKCNSCEFGPVSGDNSCVFARRSGV